MFFEDKKIFIISPQTWSSNKISKHHYADYLSSLGAIVFFFNPVKHDAKLKTTFDIIKENLYIVTIHVPFPRAFKFKLRWLFDFAVRYLFKKTLNRVGIPDILWNFDNGTYFRYEDLFRQSYRIFHPVDMMLNLRVTDYNLNYDIVFSVSSEILDRINHKKKFFINHGLHEEIIEFFRKKKKKEAKKTCLNVTYMGNISLPFINREAFLKLIDNNSHLEFRLIGELNSDCQFQKKLAKYKNVVFYGKMSGQNLYRVLENADFLLICYHKHSLYNADNTHKILEYLITGNPIISSPLSVYKYHTDIISFIDFDTDNYLNIFNQLIENYNALSSAEKREKRMDLALNNTYQKQLERIEEIISGN